MLYVLYVLYVLHVRGVRHHDWGVQRLTACRYDAPGRASVSCVSRCCDTGCDTTAPHTPCDQVYMDMTIGGEPAGRLIIGLFGATVPRAADNFRALCTGSTAPSATSGGLGLPLSYAGSAVFRVSPGFMIQGGDITKNDGSGGVSIYGPKFEVSAAGQLAALPSPGTRRCHHTCALPPNSGPPLRCTALHCTSLI